MPLSPLHIVMYTFALFFGFFFLNMHVFENIKDETTLKKL